MKMILDLATNRMECADGVMQLLAQEARMIDIMTRVPNAVTREMLIACLWPRAIGNSREALKRLFWRVRTEAQEMGWEPLFRTHDEDVISYSLLVSIEVRRPALKVAA